MKANWWIWVLFLAVRLPAQTITTQPTNQAVIIGSNVTFSVAVSGIGPFSYQWQFNGTNLPPSNITITTVAGNGTNISYGDGGAATNAGIPNPTSVAVDSWGNMFIVASGKNSIRKVDTAGIITTVVGNDSNSFSGDGGAATNATLSGPNAVAVDTGGNLFIADGFNNRIRKVDTNGIITTVAGNGNNSFSGDGGNATNAGINYAKAVAVDSHGNLFIGEGDQRIRKVTTNGGITTVAGNGTAYFYGDGGVAISAGLNNPYSLAVDTWGNLYIADSFNNRIRVVKTNGIISTAVGNGSGSFSGDGGFATGASLHIPTGVSVDGFGNLFIADYYNHRIRMVDTNGSFITTVAGNGRLSSVGDGSGTFSGDGGTATNAGLNYPIGVTVDTAGNLFIADSKNNLIRKVQIYSPLLTLNNVSTNNTGNYSVVISGLGGSVTSSIVTLTVIISPSISNQPQPMTVTNGHAANFAVTATGFPSLAYQWLFNGTNLPDSTNATLTLQNSFPANAGNYTVAINNTYGSITSNPAMLTVLPLGITAPKMLTSGQFQFSFDTATGVNYAVQFSTNLMQWFPFVTLGGIGMPLTLTDPNAPSSPQRFYRISLSAQ